MSEIVELYSVLGDIGKSFDKAISENHHREYSRLLEKIAMFYTNKKLSDEIKVIKTIDSYDPDLLSKIAKSTDLINNMDSQDVEKLKIELVKIHHKKLDEYQKDLAIALDPEYNLLEEI